MFNAMTASGPTFKPNPTTPLYNTRIIKVYLEYLKQNYPNLDLNEILKEAGLERHEIEDPAHWLNQNQVDLLHEVFIQKTGNENIAWEAGRFGAQAQGLGPIKRYALGLTSPTTMFLMIDRFYPLLSRGAKLKSKKISRNQVEIIATPAPEALEKPYQCQNRMGIFESVVHLFANCKVDIKHDECYHKGYPSCRYHIKWDLPPSHKFKNVFIFSCVFIVILLTVLFFKTPLPVFTPILGGSLLVIFFLSLLQTGQEKKELLHIIKNQGKTASDDMDDIKRRYGDALLFQEIGQFTASLHKKEELVQSVLSLLETHLDFDVGLTLLTDTGETDLRIDQAYAIPANKKLNNIPLQPEDLDPYILQSLKSINPVVINQPDKKDIPVCYKIIGEDSQQQITTAIYIPIAYEQTAIGLLIFYRFSSGRLTIESEINLLKGVAFQLALGINNVRSYQKLKESEKKYRALIETTNTGFFIADNQGYILDANAEYVRLSGHQSLDDILGKSVSSWIADIDKTRFENGLQQCRQKGFIKHLMVNYKNSQGSLVPIEMNAAVVPVNNIPCILSICRDMTEQRKAQEMLIQKEKMSTVGALAAGMAHELNNPLAAIIQTLQVLKKRFAGISPAYKELLQQHSISLEQFKKVQEEMGTFTKIDEIIDAGKRASKIIENLVNFSHKDHIHFAKHDIPALLDKTVEIAKSDYNLKKDYDFRSIEIVRNYQEDLSKVYCISGKIQQVFLSILKYGANEMSNDKKRCSSPVFKLGISEMVQKIRIEISYNVDTMTEAVRDSIFQSFFSSGDTQSGNGLELSIAYFIVKDNHHGEMEVVSVPDQETRFIITLPVDSSYPV